MEKKYVYGVEMKKLYVCHTVYHLYITMLESYTAQGENDVLLVDTIENAHGLSEQILKTRIFKHVYSISRKEYFGKAIHEYLGNYINCKFRFHKIKNKLNFLYNYSEIFLFNDYTEIGAFLAQAKIRYHLLEDGLDVFKQFNVYEEIGRAYYLKKFLYAIFKIPYSLGMSSLCVDVEVNDNQNLKSKIQKPITVKNRKTMVESIDESYRHKIFNAFGVSPIELLDKRVLILTQVLKELLVVKDDKEQFTFYKNIVCQFAGEYAVYLKPHPRDRIDYTILTKQYNVVILKKEIPLEVYAYLPDMKFNFVITYSSTAANIGNIGDKIIRLDKSLDN